MDEQYTNKPPPKVNTDETENHNIFDIMLTQKENQIDDIQLSPTVEMLMIGPWFALIFINANISGQMVKQNLLSFTMILVDR